MNIRQFTDQLHPDLPPTTLRGYAPNGAPSKHLGGIFVVQKDKPVQITFHNQLAGPHQLPVDFSIPGAMGQIDNRVAVHLHGGHVPWISDGGPMSWWDPAGNRGMSFKNHSVPNANTDPDAGEYYYPNDQTARMLWYHDHAMGITRLNAYIGEASAYIIRDNFESDLRNAGLPDFVENGGREIPIIIQDKSFNADGSLFYPSVYDADLEPNPKQTPLPSPSCVPEFFGDTMLANGTVYPEVTVEARRYRLRILNACNARFLNLQLYVELGGGVVYDRNKNPKNKPGPEFLQIGTEGGFLLQPVRMSSSVPFDPVTLKGSLIMAPAERADLIVDFSGFHNKRVVLYNDAPAPFPSGDSPETGESGSGNTREIMRFNVVGATGRPDPPLALDKIPFGLGNPVPAEIAGASGKSTLRELTLNEGFDDYGRLIQTLGTNVLVPNGQFGRAYTDPATEIVGKGTIEVWEIANLTMDTHPIHFHLVNGFILSRQLFDVDTYSGSPHYTGAARPPDPNEYGWKETVRVNPGEVIRVAMKFDLASVPFTVPSSPMGANEFVWHCHILEHEEHDMMRPLIVT